MNYKGLDLLWLLEGLTVPILNEKGKRHPLLFVLLFFYPCYLQFLWPMEEPVPIVMTIFFTFTPKKSFLKNIDFNYRKKHHPVLILIWMNSFLLGPRNVLSMGVRKGWPLWAFHSQEVRPLGLCAHVLLYTSRLLIKEAIWSASTNYPMKDIVWNVSLLFLKTCQLHPNGSTYYSKITKWNFSFLYLN